MFFNSTTFKTLEAGVQMASMQQQTHIQNISNVETPGYKSKSIEFKKVLANVESGESQRASSIRGEIVSDETSSILQDGNNVDFEKENLALYQTYVQHSMLLDKISGQVENISYVLNNNMK